MGIKRILVQVMVVLLIFPLLTACGNGAAVEGAYIITDYYNVDGSFSALGLALEEVNAEKTLVLNEGDIFIVNERQYRVMAESLVLSFYTQSSLDDVIQWWTDYVKIWSEDGIISEVK